MFGFAAVKTSTAFWVSLSRESLPHVETRSVTGPPDSLWPEPELHAAGTRRHSGSRNAVSKRRRPGTTERSVVAVASGSADASALVSDRGRGHRRGVMVVPFSGVMG